MINREWKTVQVQSFTSTLDAYGQKRQDEPTTRNIEMVIKTVSNAIVNNPKYIDIDLVGITEDKTITDENQILIDNKVYYVSYIIPSKRYYQVLMRAK